MNEVKEVRNPVDLNVSVVSLRAIKMDQNYLLEKGIEEYSKTKLERWRHQSHCCNH